MRCTGLCGLLVLVVCAVSCAPTLAQVYQEQDGYVCIEAETCNIGEYWEVHKDAETFDFLEGFTGEGCIRFTGNSESSGPARGSFPIKLRITTPGTYKLVTRAMCAPFETQAKRKGDKGNDF